MKLTFEELILISVIPPSYQSPEISADDLCSAAAVKYNNPRYNSGAFRKVLGDLMNLGFLRKDYTSGYYLTLKGSDAEEESLKAAKRLFL